MLQMSQYYEPEFKKKIVRLHLKEGRTLKCFAEEYSVSSVTKKLDHNSSRGG